METTRETIASTFLIALNSRDNDSAQCLGPRETAATQRVDLVSSRQILGDATTARDSTRPFGYATPVNPRTRSLLRTMLWIAPLFLVGALFTLSACSWSRPDTLGLQDGRLRDCPDKPNCVCSQDSREGASIAPISFEGPADAALGTLRRLVDALPRTEIITDQPAGYLHVEFTSRIMRYVDDTEFYLDPVEKVIHVRSASRVGHSDLGVNRERIEAIRTAFASQ